jgi:GlcNAc-P-P-Und epimerase
VLTGVSKISTSQANIVGGSGFIGSRLCRRLAATGEPDFRIIDKRPSRAFPDRVAVCDIRDLATLQASLVPRLPVIHLAAEHRDDVRPASLYHDVNVEGTANVCRAATATGINTIIFTSSVAVYGLSPGGTSENGAIAPFNEYGRTKWEAERVLRAWAAERPAERRLVIVRPTVVFGENNRGNVYNLLRQIAAGRFVMIGGGRNHKSMAYVENVAAFLAHCLNGPPGVEVWNYVDRPDLTMNELVGTVRRLMGRSAGVGPRIPYAVGLTIGAAFDVVARLTGRSFAISKVRVKKFCAETSFTSDAASTGFTPPVCLADAIEKTIRHEFLESHSGEELFTGE